MQVMGDAFIRAYIEDLLKNIRTQVLLKVVPVQLNPNPVLNPNPQSSPSSPSPLTSHLSPLTLTLTFTLVLALALTHHPSPSPSPFTLGPLHSSHATL